MENLKDNLEEQGFDIEKIPFVFQYNKRDLPNVSSVEELANLLNPRKLPELEACAMTGEGVFETLKAVAKLVLNDLNKGG